MDHRIETRAAFHVTGIQRRFTPGPDMDVPALWCEFVPRMETIAGRVGGLSFGVCEMIPAAGPPASGGATATPAPCPGPFLYTACVETTADAPLPAGVVRITVPGGKFAVFTYRGPIAAFGAFVQNLWSRALPASGLTPTGTPDFEEYGADFHPDRGPVEVWIPVA
jgi:AraC family transcriptional regulator